MACSCRIYQTLCCIVTIFLLSVDASKKIIRLQITLFCGYRCKLHGKDGILSISIVEQIEMSCKGIDRSMTSQFRGTQIKSKGHDFVLRQPTLALPVFCCQIIHGIYIIFLYSLAIVCDDCLVVLQWPFPFFKTEPAARRTDDLPVRYVRRFENFQHEQASHFSSLPMMVDTEQNRRMRRPPGTKPYQPSLQTIGYDKGR